MKRSILILFCFFIIFPYFMTPTILNDSSLRNNESKYDVIYKAFLDLSVEVIKPNSNWSLIESYFGIEINGSNVVIAILDTGIDSSHLDLDDLDDNASSSDPKVINSISFVTGEDANDYNGHGTHVAGIVAGTGNASSGLYQGVAPGARLLNVKVLNSSAIGLEQNISDGIAWAVTNGADIINLSLGSDTVGNGSDLVSQKIDWAVSQGVIVVVAAGKQKGHYNVTIPGVARSAITVGATDDSDNLYVNNPYGPTLDFRLKPEVLAPGVNIISCRASLPPPIGTPIDGNYTQVSGTSMACAHVSGAIALLLQAHPDWYHMEVRSALMGTGKDISSNLYEQGGGRINCSAAVNQTLFFDNSSVNFGLIPMGNHSEINVTLKNTEASAMQVNLVVSDTQFTLSHAQVNIPATSEANITIRFEPTSFSHQFAFLNATHGNKWCAIPVIGTCPAINVNWTNINNASLYYNIIGDFWVDDDLSEFSVYTVQLKRGTNVINQTFLDETGSFSMSNIRLPRGEHSLYLEVLDGDQVIVSGNSTTLTVQGIQVTFIPIITVQLIHLSQVNIQFSSVHSLNGTLEIYISGIFIRSIQIQNGQAIMSLTVLTPPGTYQFNFTFTGDDQHEPITISGMYTIMPNLGLLFTILLIIIGAISIPTGYYRYRWWDKRRPKKMVRKLIPSASSIDHYIEAGKYAMAAELIENSLRSISKKTVENPNLKNEDPKLYKDLASRQVKLEEKAFYCHEQLHAKTNPIKRKAKLLHARNMRIHGLKLRTHYKHVGNTEKEEELNRKLKQLEKYWK